MSTIEIKHRVTNSVLWSGDAGSLRDAVIAAAISGADLRDADLSDADLSGADLSDADLSGADLRDADLSDADLSDADLSGADLSDADLRDAYLRGADLRGADLSGARNAPDLSKHGDPIEPYKRQGKTRQEHAAAYRERHPDVPVIHNLDQKILDAIATPGCALDMGSWHSCETTHCRAGWAIHLAGKAGYDLEERLGDAALAGRAIYRASTGRSPHFYATTERALEDIKRCAEEDAKGKNVGIVKIIIHAL